MPHPPQFSGSVSVLTQRPSHSVRLAWQDEIAETMTGAVERITGHRVLDYHSQVLLQAELAIEMFAIEGRSQREVADALDCSVEAVKWYVFQGRKKLRELLKDLM